MNPLAPLFYHRCDVFESIPLTDEKGITHEIFELVQENMPCRFKYISSPIFSQPPKDSSTGKLYIPPEFSITEGARIIIYLEKKEIFYIASRSAAFLTHDEVMLHPIGRWF